MRKTLTILPLIIGLSTTAFAQAPDMPNESNEGTGYIGATALYSSEYLGSADEEFRALPYLSFENVEGFDFFGTALTYRAVDVGTGQGFGKWSFRGGPRVAYVPGRDSDDSPNLTGFEDVDGSLPIGGYAFGTIGPVGLRLDAGQDVINGHDGFTADASVGTAYIKDNYGIQPSFTVSWGDNSHNDSFFSVTNEQSSASGLDAFNAGSGIYGYSANIVSWLEFEEKYAVVFLASYRWFTDDAADSPILNADDGDDNGLYTGLSIVRKFDTNKW